MICNVTGKKMYTKEQGRMAASVLRGQYKGRSVSRWCIYCGTYHVTKGLIGKKGRRDFR
jgi:hypothetical protein